MAFLVHGMEFGKALDFLMQSEYIDKARETQCEKSATTILSNTQLQKLNKEVPTTYLKRVSFSPTIKTEITSAFNSDKSKGNYRYAYLPDLLPLTAEKMNAVGQPYIHDKDASQRYAEQLSGAAKIEADLALLQVGNNILEFINRYSTSPDATDKNIVEL